MLVMLDEPQATDETYGYNLAGWNAAPAPVKLSAALRPCSACCRILTILTEQAALALPKYRTVNGGDGRCVSMS